MKKILLLILACGSPALAAINVTEGSGKTVRTITSGAQEVQGVFLTDGISSVTVTSAGSLLVTSTNTPAIFLASGTATSPFYFNPASTLNTASTGTVIPVAVFLASGTAANPFIVTAPVAVFLASGTASNPINVVSPVAVFLASGTTANPFMVDESYAIQLASSTFNVILVSSGGPSNPLFVSVLSSGSAGNPWYVNTPVAIQLSSGGPNNPLSVAVLNNSTATFNGVPQPIWSTMTVPSGVLVSSTSFLQAFTQGSTVAMMADPQGRLVNADIPFEMQVTTYNAVLGGDVVEHVLISSATGALRIRMCGCIFMNTSATNTGYTLYASTSNNIPQNVVGARAFPIGVPANYAPSGIRNDCGRPFMIGNQGGQITYKASATQAAAMNCTYYTQ